jgi:hypothetical protein
MIAVELIEQLPAAVFGSVRSTVPSLSGSNLFSRLCDHAGAKPISVIARVADMVCGCSLFTCSLRSRSQLHEFSVSISHSRAAETHARGMTRLVPGAQYLRAPGVCDPAATLPNVRGRSDACPTDSGENIIAFPRYVSSTPGLQHFGNSSSKIPWLEGARAQLPRPRHHWT